MDKQEKRDRYNNIIFSNNSLKKENCKEVKLIKS